MIAAVSLILVLGLQADQTSTFSNKELNFTFSYPKEWKSSTAKGVSKLEFAIADANEGAVLEIYPVAFQREESLWMSLQADLAKQMGHEVVRQTTEQLMGVPLILLQTRYADGGRDLTSLQGLLYSATAKKLLFRLTAPTGSYGRAEAQWRALWPSMRTVDGTLPEPEDPNRVVSAVDPVKAPIRPAPITVLGGSAKRPVELAPVAIDCKAAGRSIRLRVPEGWSGTLREDGVVLLGRAELGEPLEVSVLSTLDSDPPGRALFKASAASLDLFDRVGSREEPRPKPNRAAAVSTYVWRVGTSSGAEVRSLDAVGQSGEFYWLFSRRWKGSEFDPQVRLLLMALIDAMSVEQVP